MRRAPLVPAIRCTGRIHAPQPFVTSVRRLAPLLVLLGIAAVPSALLTIVLTPTVREDNPVASGALAGGNPNGLLALKAVGLFVSRAILMYVHAWIPRAARAGRWEIFLLLLMDDAWDVVQAARLMAAQLHL